LNLPEQSDNPHDVRKPANISAETDMVSDAVVDSDVDVGAQAKS
jgi:hypothetical protein